jgi:putative peptide zinc metalloprotease protein
MNLAEALDVLPELPVSHQNRRIFTMDTRYVGREHIEEGEPIVLAHIPGSAEIFRFSPQQWILVHFFDGVRTYDEIAHLMQEETGAEYDPEDLRNYAQQLEELDFWYKTPQEKNFALMQKLRDKRKKQKKARSGDLSRIVVAQWDADALVTRAHGYLTFLYTPWFTALTLVCFAFTAYVFFDRWGQIGSDTLRYYTFTEKTALDLAEFWLLFCALAFFHEAAHAVTCKHYGGGVHSTGFHLIYLTPAFFVDVTQAWVYANRFQRVVTMVAGIWTELIICSFATLLWWGTPAGTFVHEFSYKVMLITGVAVVLMNLNPLIKLDGYYILSEIVGIDEIKERSTSFVSTWVRRKIFRLPVEIDYISPRRRWFFVPYAFLSGLYSYLLLYAVARFSGNVFRNYSPTWAFVPTILVAVLIFKSRIRKLGNFMQTVYLDKRDRWRAWLKSPVALASAAVLAIFLLLPVFTDRVTGPFILEPVNRAVLRTEVPGNVIKVMAREGQSVTAGEPLLQLQDFDLESQVASSHGDLDIANARVTQAALRYKDYGPAEHDRQRLSTQYKTLDSEQQKLELRSPIIGTVVTPRPQELQGMRLNAGAEAIEIADLSHMRARIFVTESEMRDIRLGQTVKLLYPSLFHSGKGEILTISPSASQLEPGLEPASPYKGITSPAFYMVTVSQSNPNGELKYGMTGTAKIYTVRRSLAAVGLRSLRDFIRRKLW